MKFLNTTLLTITASVSSTPYLTTWASPESKPQATPFILQVDPWTIFNNAWKLCFGYPAADFTFVPGTTPLSTFAEAGSWIILYYVAVFGGRELMRHRRAFTLQRAFIVHNLYLTIISGALLGLFIQQLVPSLWTNGLYDNVCGRSGWTDKLVVLYYLNYLTKYLELLDTIFLVLKKKSLTFLHTYHHGATALLCYTQLVGETSVSWVPITLNLTVHVVMYFYYYQSARGIKVWWKQYITMLQIMQFVLDLGFIYFACYNYVASTYAPSLPHVGTCGDPKQELAAFTGCAIISSYLILFISFYLSNYNRKASTKTMRRLSKAGIPQLDVTAGRIHSAGLCLAEKLSSEKCGLQI